MKRSFNKIPKLHIRKDDTVKVLAGNDRAKTGKVLSVDPEKRMAVVEGVNVKTKHMKPSATNPEGGIKTIEAPVHVSNLMLVDPKSGEATKIGRKRNDEGKLQRYSKKSGDFIS